MMVKRFCILQTVLMHISMKGGKVEAKQPAAQALHCLTADFTVNSELSSVLSFKNRIS